MAPAHRNGSIRRPPGAIVIGAGPYGLSIASYLKVHNVEASVLGSPMRCWSHNMPAGMLLKSVPSASSIAAPAPGSTLEDYCRRADEHMPTETDPISRELFVRYGMWFQDRWVPDLETELVEQVTRTGSGFSVRLTSGDERHASAVVVASGAIPHAYLPPLLEHARPEGASWLTHSSEHDDLSVFAGRRLAVIGAGQSALETAVLAAEAGASVDLVCRTPSLLWSNPPAAGGWRATSLFKPPSPLGPGWAHASVARGAPWIRHLPASARLEMVRRVLGPSGAWWLHQRFDGADIRVHRGQEVQSLQPGTSDIQLQLGPSLEWQDAGATAPAATSFGVDHVIAATGFRVTVDRFEFLEEKIRNGLRCDGGFPRLSRGFESTVPGLFFAGLPAAGTFGPLLRFVCGTSVCSPRLAAGVARHASQQASQKVH